MYVCTVALPTDTVAPQGVVGVFRRPHIPWGLSSNMLLLLDAIQDPGNVGTILRSACAAGVRGVLLTPGCADAWGGKVVRSGMGAHFRIPILENVQWADVPYVAQIARQVYWSRDASELNVERIDPQSVPVEPAFVPVIAHSRREAGIMHWTYTECPMLGETAAESNSRNTNGCSDERICLLVIGSEAHGPSEAAFELARNVPDSCTAEIPMVAGTESLNAAVAASVILFDAQRRRMQMCSSLTSRGVDFNTRAQK